MKVAELIQILQTMPQDAEVAVYEAEPDDYLEVGKVDIADNGNQVRISSQFAVDGGYV